MRRSVGKFETGFILNERLLQVSEMGVEAQFGMGDMR